MSRFIVNYFSKKEYKFEKCYECNEIGHGAYECDIRKAQYKKLGLPITNRLKPLRCIYCNVSKKLLIECKHIVCIDCDYKNNIFGCCRICYLEETGILSEPNNKICKPLNFVDICKDIGIRVN